jgi:TRAP-type C4-dicarboxylate transport system permease small subunit
MKARLAKGYMRLLEGCGLLAGLTIGALAVLISVDIVGRNLGLFNFPWLLEVSEYCLYGSTFIAAPWVLHLGAHVRVDVLVEALPRAAARGLEVVVDCIGGAVSLVLGYYGLRATADAFRLGSRVAKELTVPEWWLLVIIPLSAALLAVEFGRRIVRAVHGGLASGDEDRAAGAL